MLDRMYDHCRDVDHNPYARIRVYAYACAGECIWTVLLNTGSTRKRKRTRTDTQSPLCATTVVYVLRIRTRTAVVQARMAMAMASELSTRAICMYTPTRALGRVSLSHRDRYRYRWSASTCRPARARALMIMIMICVALSVCLSVCLSTSAAMSLKHLHASAARTHCHPTCLATPLCRLSIAGSVLCARRGCLATSTSIHPSAAPGDDSPAAERAGSAVDVVGSRGESRHERSRREDLCCCVALHAAPLRAAARPQLSPAHLGCNLS